MKKYIQENKIKNQIKTIALALMCLTPTLSYAALSGVGALLSDFGGLINALLYAIFGLSLVYFFWGTSQFILHAGDEKTREDGKQKMIWGIVALFVMVSIYGILNWISATLEIDQGGDITNGLFG